MIKVPTIQSVTTAPGHRLLVGFSDGARRSYSVLPLTERDMFAPLKDEAFFRNVKIEEGGYALSWDSDIDISEYEIWQHGQPMP